MTRVSRVAICPGSFDPMTNGHADMIRRAAGLFDRLVVAVLVNPSKQPWFGLAERVEMVRAVVAGMPDADRVEVDTFDGLLAEYARTRGAVAIVRGLRSESELAEEAPMAMTNRHLNDRCETVFLVASPAVAFISSRLVREVAALGGPVDGLVPPVVATHLAQRRTAHLSVRT